MKKIIFFVCLFMFLPIKAFAAGSVDINKSSLSITTGKTSNFTVTAKNSAGKVTFSSSDVNIATVSSNAEWLDNSAITITVMAKKAGTATITVNVDAATYDEEAFIKTYTIKVNVEDAKQNSTTSQTPTTTGTTKSDNNNIKKLIIEGYEIDFKPEVQEYKIEVENDVDSLDIKVTPDDKKATYTIINNKYFNEGLNVVKVKVTSESGKSKTYTINVNKKSKNIEVTEEQKIDTPTNNEQIDSKRDCENKKLNVVTVSLLLVSLVEFIFIIYYLLFKKKKRY